MDPVTHALIGMAVSAAGQESFSLLNPVTIATVAGSVIPDGDIILRLKGGSFYLKHHRGESHSLIGVALEAAFIGLALKLFYPGASVLTMTLWAFIGTLSHIIMDILNSYGARIFWPFRNKKFSLSLLTITDPVVVILPTLSIVFSYRGWQYGSYIIWASAFYLFTKVAMRAYGRFILKKRLGHKYKIQKIHLLPSMIASYKFHYIINDPEYKVVGDIDFLKNRVNIIKILKRLDRATVEYILNSKTADYFKEFTPIFHVEMERVNEGYKALLTDLRYIFRSNFLHHATIIYDRDMNLIEEKFNPYNINTMLDV